MWKMFIEYRNKLEFISKNKMPMNLLHGFIYGCCIMCIYQAYTRLCQECLSFSIHSNIVQPLRPRQNFSFSLKFLQFLPIQCFLFLAVVGELLEILFAQAAPRSSKSEPLWGGSQASICLRCKTATMCSRD